MADQKEKRRVTYETHGEPFLKRITNWTTHGATLTEVAAHLGVARSTLLSWRKEHKDFEEAVKAAARIANDKVVAATFKRACGYEYEEVVEKPLVDVIAKKVVDEYNARLGEGGTKITIDDFKKSFGKEIIVAQKIRKHVPGDVTAQIFWLTNREKNEWKHRSEQTIRNEEDVVSKIDKAKQRLADAEFKEKAKKDGSLIELPNNDKRTAAGE
jgi:transposase-like protein